MAYIKNDLRRNYCFVLYVGMRRFEGDSERIALEKLFAAFGTCYGDIKTVLHKCGIVCEVEPKDEQDALKIMFVRMKIFDVGSWMWYDGVLQDQWRLTTDRQSIILKADWQRKPISEETKKHLQENLKRANLVKAEHPECYESETYRETRPKRGCRHITEEHKRRLAEGRRRYWANASQEKRNEQGERLLAGRKRSEYAGRKKAEIVTLGEGETLTRCISTVELRKRYLSEVEKYDKHESGHGRRTNRIVDKYRSGKPVIVELDGANFVMMLLVGKLSAKIKWGVTEQPYCLEKNCRAHF